jgi:hypothetical protein
MHAGQNCHCPGLGAPPGIRYHSNVGFKKIIGQFSLLAAVALVIYVLAQIAIYYRSESTQILEKIWFDDIQALQTENKLPISWKEIRQVEKIPAQGDSEAALWVKSIASPILINPEGEYKLEILFISQKDDGHEKAVIQHHLIHIPSGNSVWELGRTYEISN